MLAATPPIHPLVIRSMARLSQKECVDAYLKFVPLAIDPEKRSEYEHGVAQDIAERISAVLKDEEKKDMFTERALLESDRYVFMRNEKIMDVLFPDRMSVSHSLLDEEEEEEDESAVIQVMNRNARKPKKANHGARPCSRVGRRKRRYSKYKKSGTKV
jgi:hypothetical protein